MEISVCYWTVPACFSRFSSVWCPMNTTPVQSHLLSDDGQWVFLFRQEVEDAPDLESVFVRDEEVGSVEVLTGAQGPAHSVKVLPVKVVLDLQLGTVSGQVNKRHNKLTLY